jgi:tetratricopeptide (TPR) repeat protein
MRSALVAIALLVAGPSPARADAAADFAAAVRAVQADQLPAALELFTSAIRSNEMQGASLANALYNRALVYERLGDLGLALGDYQAFRKLLPDDPDGPDKVAAVAVALKRFDEARAALEFLLERYPNAAPRRRWDVIQVARFDQLQARWAEAEALLAGYARIDGRDNPVRLARARSAAALGKTREALDLIRAIDNQYTLVLVRADKGFERLWNEPDFVAATDLGSHFRRDLARLERETARAADRLGPLVQWMGTLRRSGRLGDAALLGEEAIALLPQFFDRQDYEHWLYNEIALSAQLLGDGAGAERAYRAYRAGIDALGMTSVDSVNLLLNGGLFLARETDKYRDAIEFATQAERLGASPFGLMVARAIRVAAYAGLNRQADMERVLAEMLARVNDNAEKVIEALLLAGRTEQAAQVVADQLADPVSVDVVLLALQRVVERPPSMSQAGQAIEFGWEQLRGHPKVTAALARVGRITEVSATAAF